MEIVYQYALQPPTENGDLIIQQMYDANKYRNVLTKAEIYRRNIIRAALSEDAVISLLDSQIAEARERLNALEDELKAKRAERRNKKDPEPLRAEHAAAKEQLSNLTEERRQARLARRNNKAGQRLADEAAEELTQFRAEQRKIVSQRGQRMRPGTYQLVEIAANQASQKTPFYRKGKPNDPKFKRWTHEGSVGEQIRKDMVSNDFFRIQPVAPSPKSAGADCTTCRRTNANGNGFTCPPHSERTNGCRRNCPITDGSRGTSKMRELWIVVRIDPKTHERTWAKFPMIMHRPIPPLAVVTFVTVSRRKVGPRVMWTVDFALRLPDVAPKKTIDPKSVIAIDIGWRVMGDQIRVATWYDHNGGIGELRLNSSRGPSASDMREAAAIGVDREAEFRAARDALCAWLRLRDMPAWMLARTVHHSDGVPSQDKAIDRIAAWPDSFRLTSLCSVWSKNRIEGDRQAFEDLLAWRRRDATQHRKQRKLMAGTKGEIDELRLRQSLQSTRDTNFNDARDQLHDWLKQHDMPDWMRLRTVKRQYDENGKEIERAVPSKDQALAYLKEWESQGKLAALVHTWGSNRFPGDSDMFAKMEAWRYHDKHLWCWESSQRRGALRMRRELYRRFANKLANEYQTVLLEDFKLSDVAKKEPKDSKKTENAQARSNRVLAAVSELRNCIVHKFHGARAQKVPCRNTTRTCHVCGVVETFDAAKERTHKCCNGHVWDQDENAAKNLMHIYLTRRSECAPWIKEKDGPGSKQKSRNGAKERRARLASYREEDMAASSDN